jgi:selenide,water dikinase
MNLPFENIERKLKRMENSDSAQAIRLTSLSSCAGCASKLNAHLLSEVLAPVKTTFAGMQFPDLLIGLEAPDDAAVWKIDDQRALVITTDFFTPIVDTPYEYGAIAATNAISDIYAMGGKPFLALNIAALPASLPPEFLAEIIRGGAETARKAGIAIAGGHTVQDKEPKFGLVVLGFVDPARMFTKGGAQPGDHLVLTKPLGFGVTTTALKRDIVAPADLAEVIGWMTTLNEKASQLALDFGIRAATDVTGFSLMGHGTEMARASQAGMQIYYRQLPFVQGARKYAEQGAFAGGAFDNRAHFGGGVRLPAGMDEVSEMLLFDPQTSGGLLMAVPDHIFDRFTARAAEISQPFWEIGRVIAGSGIEIIA